MNHLSVGLEGRDRVNNAVGGGFPEGSLVLIEGDTGAGKSVLISRFVYGFCEEGTSVGMASTQDSAAEFVSGMHSLSYDVVDHLLDGRLRYFRVPVEEDRPFLDRFLDPGPLWANRAVVVDGFGALCRNDSRFAATLGTGEEDRAMERVTARLDEALAAERLVMLTVNPASMTDRALRPLRSAADVYFELQSEAVGQEIRKKAMIRRFVGMRRPVDDTIGFSVQQGRGIVIESRTIA